MKKKILLVQLSLNGDCLIVTTLARQIKHDYPGCLLTWAISAKCKQVIENNPFIDNVWEVNYNANEPFENVWEKLKREINIKMKNGDFDKVYYTQIYPDNMLNFDGTTRSSTFRAYPKKITVPVNPTIKLYDVEIKRVKDFAITYNLHQYNHVVLMECAPSSGQSFFNIETAIKIAEQIVDYRKDIIVIISSHLKLNLQHNRIIDASELTYRENAELSKYCTLLIGCSSGITWLLSSDWAKKIPTIQFLRKDAIGFQFASVKYDFDYWGLNTSDIIESSQQNPETAAKIIIDAIDNFDSAKSLYHEEFKPKLESLKIFVKRYFSFKYFIKTIRMIFNFISRNDNKFYNFSSITIFIGRLLFQKIKNRLRSTNFQFSKCIILSYLISF